ncbi:MAG: ABC transporter permease [Promethearchaeota archaeon]
MMNDSLSASTLEVVTDNVGAGDIVFTHQTSFSIGDDYSFPEDELQGILDVDEIESYYPRVVDFVETRGRRVTGTTGVEGLLQDWQSQVLLYGIDNEKERLGGLGSFFSNDTGEPFTSRILKDHCLLLTSAARLLDVGVGDSIEVKFANNTANLTVQAVVTQEAKFTAVERNLVVINLDEAQWLLRRVGRINYLVATLKDSERYYNTRNLDSSIEQLRAIGMEIDGQLPDEDYSFYMPKLTVLDLTQIVFTPLSVFYWFVTIISMIVTGLLIYGTVSTSSEQIVYEMGMLRVMGARKGRTYKVMLVQGLIVSLAGTTMGVALALAYTPFILDFVYNYFSLINQPIPLVVLPGTLSQSFLLVLGLVIAVSLIPARNAANRLVAEAINPYRQTDARYRIAKEGSPNLKMVVVGVAISLLGVLLFVVLPGFLADMDYFLLLMVFLVLLIMTLVGLVLVAVVAVPALEQLMVRAVRPATRRSGNVIEFSLKRYRRRNLTTTLMFAFSFTFVFFIGGQTRVLQESVSEFFDYQYGSEVVLARTTSAEEGATIDQHFVDEVAGIPHVVDAIPVMHNTVDLTLLLNGKLADLQAQYQNEGKMDVQVGDYINYHNTRAGLIGVPRDYERVVDPGEVLFQGGGLSWEEAFSGLFTTPRSCILSKAVADLVGASPGGSIRLTFANGSSVEAFEFKVAGVAARLPGFWNFRQSWYSTFSGGVLVSLDTYREYMNVTLGSPGYDQFDKVFVSLDDRSQATVDEVKTEIDQVVGGDYQYAMDDYRSKASAVNRYFQTFSVIMDIILFLSVVISLFGLLSSTQNKVMERQHEIGILEALGLRKSEARNMFVVEATISMVSAGLLGTFIGLALTWLIKFELTYLLEIPFVLVLPWATIAWIYGAALGIGLVGLFVVLRREFEKPPLEFFHRAS